MHFTSKKPLNLPYYLFRSLCKVTDRVQAKESPIEPSLFHFSLIKLLVVKEFEKKEQSWRDFLASSGWIAQSSNSQRTKKDTPSVVIKEASPIAASLVKNPLTKNKSVVKRSAKKLHFSLEVETMVRVSRTRASAKRLPLDPTPTPVQVVELESTHVEIEVDERDQKIKDFHINWTRLT